MAGVLPEIGIQGTFLVTSIDIRTADKSFELFLEVFSALQESLQQLVTSQNKGTLR